MKKVCLFVLLLIATISLTACISDSPLPLDDRKDLPTLKVVSENEIITAEVGTSSWTINNKDGSKTTMESDTAGPVELVKESDSLKVSSGYTLELDFSVAPKDITVNIWEENKQLEQDSTDMKIVVPNSEGLIIYEVIANWEEGTIHYAFSVNIE